MKKLLLSSALVTASFILSPTAVAAGHGGGYDFVSGGLSHTRLKDEIPTKTDARDRKESKNVSGLYLRGSWNFFDHVYGEARIDYRKKNDLSYEEGLIGLGYYYPVDDKLSVNALAGYSSTRTKLGEKFKDNGLSVEVGAKYQVVDIWSFEPAINYRRYDINRYELRLGNSFKVTDDISIEANLNVLQYKEDGSDSTTRDTRVELGARYTF
ncbi:outer membrane beta-barrel protein [Veronia pacifica]|uniref:Outer membrane protein beta-barrel domain-containing protein n=1 Tax=Veronia pacifica TaxID=1080227 RepID=A0A1C3ESN2_9GAMM|nr:outer membrane beta-barrel protein [Veronia pacifica]ODA36238.1 hypothetical protein A8L45_01160 [Veronia pacifica]